MKWIERWKLLQIDSDSIIEWIENIEIIEIEPYFCWQEFSEYNIGLLGMGKDLELFMELN